MRRNVNTGRGILNPRPKQPRPLTDAEKIQQRVSDRDLAERQRNAFIRQGLLQPVPEHSLPETVNA